MRAQRGENFRPGRGTARPADPSRAQRGENFEPGRPDRPTQAARSAAKIWVGTVPTDRPYLAHPGDVQCTIDFAPPGDSCTLITTVSVRTITYQRNEEYTRTATG